MRTKTKTASTNEAETTKSSSTQDDKISSSNDNLIFGLFLAGTIVFRTKRYITTPQTEIVTYTIVDDKDHRYFVDDYSPDIYYEKDQYVTIPIYVKPYKKKTGEASYSLNVLKPFRPSIGKGEAF